MAYTRAQAEASLVARQKVKMAYVSFAVTTAGSNADLNDPLAVALRKLGKTASSPVSDSDLTTLTDEQWDELLDRAELRLLQSISGNLDEVDISVGPRRESLSQLSAQVDKAIERLEARIEKEYGGFSALKSGRIGLGFQETLDE